MKVRNAAFRIGFTAWLGACLLTAAAHAAFLEKKFAVRQDRGRDVLCDVYTVKKNDYVTKLFKQRGEIAYRDFPMFLEIFKRLNPVVKNIDLIYPDQRLLIPLRIIEPNTLEGQETGTVTIPLITITNIPRQLQQNSMNYVVQQGDSVSTLIAKKFGRYSSRPYAEAIQIFKYLNPDIKDLNLIRVGQTINIPVPAIRDELWYPEIFDDAGDLKVPEESETAKIEVADVPLATVEAIPPPPEMEIPARAEAVDTVAPEITRPDPVEEIRPEPLSRLLPAMGLEKDSAPVPVPAAAPSLVEPSPEEPEEKTPPPESEPVSTPVVPLPSIFKKAAAIFGAELLDTGSYFFPRPGGPDLSLDLTATPVMEFETGRRILFGREASLSPADQQVVTAFWDNVHIVTMSYDASLRELLYTICQIMGKDGCGNHFSAEDRGVRVTLRGELIYDNPAGSGKVCVTLIKSQNEKMAGEIYHYLAAKQLKISEWIDTENYFGPVTQVLAREPAAGDTILLGAGRPQRFVKDFAAAFGMKYQENVEISFPYAGFQVSARSNLLTVSPGTDFLVDFGDLQGDAVAAIEKTGFTVLQIPAGMDGASIADVLIGRMPVQQENNPVFAGAERSVAYNADVQVAGRLVTGIFGKRAVKMLITDMTFHDQIMSFLARKGIRVMKISGNP